VTDLIAKLNIELNVTCPHCDEYFDLMEVEGGRLNDEGHLIKQACPDGFWSESHDQFEEKVNCPECGFEIDIKGIDW
jgi:ssDNA-binding Zn-finger/Zn-ribbon topoisomerase 1